MADLHVLQAGKLTAFLAGYATADEELAVRVAAPLVSDRDPLLGAGGGLTWALRTNRMTTDQDVVGQFALSASRVKGDQTTPQAGLPASERIQRISLVDHQLASREIQMTVQLVTADQSRTVTFDLVTA